MEIGVISELLSTVGFPIFCVVCLGYFIYTSYQAITKNNIMREEKLYEMLGETRTQLTQAQNTNAEFVKILENYRTDLEDIKSDVSDIKERIK